MRPFNKTLLLVFPFLDAINAANRTIIDNAPSVSALNVSRTCLSSVVGLLNQSVLLDLLQKLNHTVATITDLSVVDSNLALLQTSLNNLPNLTSMAAHMSYLNVSVKTLPDVNNLCTSLIQLNSTLNSLTILDSVDSKLATFQSVKDSYNPTNLTSQLAAIDGAFETMPDFAVMANEMLYPNATCVPLLLEQLVQLNDSLNAMPSFDNIGDQVSYI